MTLGGAAMPADAGAIMNARRGRTVGLVILGAALGLWGPTVAAAPSTTAPVTSYVLLGEDGARVARVITPEAVCPSLRLDGGAVAMAPRAPAQTVVQRVTTWPASLSKPSVFDGLVCEATIPAGVKTASVGERILPLPPTVIRRIVVIGDTGCRITPSVQETQDCGPKGYPFARVAASAARWKPDLVVHVGDFIYREIPCPGPKAGCAGSVWGYGADAWRADFFTPAEPLLTAAPLALARGNHETCVRAGQGWWRYLDPRPYVAGRDCNDPAGDGVGDFTDPYAVPLGDGAQLIMFDSAATTNKPLPATDPRAIRYRDNYAAIARLAAAQPHSILVNHHPILGFGARQGADGKISVFAGNGGLQSVFGGFGPRFVPAGVDLSLAGHIHLWEAVGFSSDHPAQIIAGFSGTKEDTLPMPASPPVEAALAEGAVVKAFSAWTDGFGFMTMQRRGPAGWDIQVRDVDGGVVNTCRLRDRDLICAVAQVAHHP
jgi:hypothetical protein